MFVNVLKFRVRIRKSNQFLIFSLKLKVLYSGNLYNRYGDDHLVWIKMKIYQHSCNVNLTTWISHLKKIWSIHSRNKKDTCSCEREKQENAILPRILSGLWIIERVYWSKVRVEDDNNAKAQKLRLTLNAFLISRTRENAVTTLMFLFVLLSRT